MRTFYECKTEEQKQALRDDMLQTMYYQVIATRSEVAEIRAKVKAIEKKLVYVGATPEERKYINVDGSIKCKCSIVGTFNKSLNCGKIRLYESY